MENGSQDRRFGNFSFDIDRAVLLRDGAPVQLKRQSAEVLAMLLRAEGRIVTRDEIRQEIWPDRTIEFDHGINTAIKDIRTALHDDSKAPNYIETHPKMGYRFIAPLKQTDRSIPWFQRRAIEALGLVALGVVLLAAGTIWGVYAGRSTPLPRLAVMPVQVAPADSSELYLADRLTALLVRDLSEGQDQALIISAGELFGGDRPDPSMADMSRWLEADYLLAGTLAPVENRQILSLRLIRTDGYIHVWAQSVDVTDLDEHAFASVVREIVSTLSVTTS